MQASQACIDLLKRFEGLATKPCFSSLHGALVIGYGHKCGMKSNVVVTRDEAELLLCADVKRASLKVERALNAAEVNVNQNQFDALVAFAYDQGIDGLLNSQLWQRIEVGDMAGAAKEFTQRELSCCYGKPLRGLELRRAAEQRLFTAPRLG